MAEIGRKRQPGNLVFPLMLSFRINRCVEMGPTVFGFPLKRGDALRHNASFGAPENFCEWLVRKRKRFSKDRILGSGP